MAPQSGSLIRSTYSLVGAACCRSLETADANISVLQSDNSFIQPIIFPGLRGYEHQMSMVSKAKKFNPIFVACLGDTWSERLCNCCAGARCVALVVNEGDRALLQEAR